MFPPDFKGGIGEISLPQTSSSADSQVIGRESAVNDSGQDPSRPTGEFLFRLWQKGPQSHERNERLACLAHKSRRAPKMVDDQARKPLTERCTDTHYSAEHALSEVEASRTFRHIGDGKSRHHAEHGPSDAVQSSSRRTRPDAAGRATSGLSVNCFLTLIVRDQIVETGVAAKPIRRRILGRLA